MKIAIIGSDNYDSIEYNLDEAFNHIRHEAQIFDILRDHTYLGAFDVDAFDRLAQKVEIFCPDLVIGVYRFIHPSFVIRMKNNKFKIIQINPDPLTTFQQQQLFVMEYDLYFTKDPFIKRFMESNLKLNVRLYSEAFNKRIHVKPGVDKLEYEKDYDMDVVTYGSMYPYRNRMLRILTEHSVNLKIFGEKSRPFYDNELDNFYTNYFITGKTKAKILYGARIVINFMNYAEIESVNNRFFETNGSGAFQLSDFRPILKDLLPVDPELVSFRSIDEAIEKIWYYLKHPEERVAIAEKIYNHFLDNYTYDHLIQYVLDSL